MRLQEDTYMPKPGVTSLMKAAVQETPAEIVALLKAGADTNAEDSSGWTAQMYAAQAGKLERLKFLPTAGAKAGHRSKAGETVIFAAVSSWYDPCNESEFAQGGRNRHQCTGQIWHVYTHDCRMTLLDT